MAEASKDPSTLDPGSLEPIETDSYPAKTLSAAATQRDPRPASGSAANTSTAATSNPPRANSLSSSPESEGDSHETLISSQPERPLFPGHGFVTGTQPSMPAFAEPPSTGRDLRRMWHIDEQLHRQDARMRLLEKELAKSRKIAIVALGLGAVGLGVGLLSLVR